MKNSKVKRTLVLFIVVAVLGFAHIYLRMQNVEQQLSINKLQRKIKEVDLVNKELKAQRATLLSSEKLKGYANKYQLREPSSKQVVVLEDE